MLYSAGILVEADQALAQTQYTFLKNNPLNKNTDRKPSG